MWTDREKQDLIALYPVHTTAELCSLLNKTEGQIRGMKERLGLRSKYKPTSVSEIDTIRSYYLSHPDEIDLEPLSKELGRSKTYIARVARRLCLTRRDRKPSAEAIEKVRKSNEVFRQTDKYKNETYPAQVELLRFYAQNDHPKGMLGKHHTDETRSAMSSTHKALWAKATEKERLDFGNKIRNGLIKNGTCRATDNTYSRCRGGFRDDLCHYFRSAWEANIARILTVAGFKWEYEPTRFTFLNNNDGVLSYCPDFYLSDYDVWLEVKGWMDDKSKLRLSKFESEYPTEYGRLILIGEYEYKMLSTIFSSSITRWEYK